MAGVQFDALKKKQTELIRKSLDGSVFLASVDAAAITALTDTTDSALRALPGNSSAVSEVQTIGLGAATAGTVAITFDGQTTTALPWNATSAAVQTALEALSNVAPGEIVASGGPFPGVVTLTFAAAKAASNQSTITAVGTGLTAGTITIATPTPGSSVINPAMPWGDLGWLSGDGAQFSRDVSTSDVTSWGSISPTRSDVTADSSTLAVACQETKLMTIGLATGMDMSSIVPTAGSGEVQIKKPSRPSSRHYRVLSVAVDQGDAGEIYVGRFLPRAKVTGFSEQSFGGGDDPIMWGVTFTGYEDTSLGFSESWMFGGPGWKALLTRMGFPAAL